jgi:hypothetical protein
LRARWMIKMSKWDPEDVVFLDETACTGRTPNRRWGWSSRGYACRVRRVNIKIKRWSILPAFLMDGYIAVEYFQGSFNTERFNVFVRNEVLPRMRPGMILAVDNASSHNEEVHISYFRGRKIADFGVTGSPSYGRRGGRYR